jgi:hypothetical protein
MLFHASIPADDPEHVARVIAELWRGSVTPFPPCPGAFMAWANDERRTVIDVFPRGQQHVPAPGQFELRAASDPSPYSEAHLALGTRVSVDEILAIARREGWRAQRSERGGLFDVVELWVENKFLLELLPESQLERYRENLTLDKFRATFGLEREE